MSDDIVTWEGVPITELSREELMDVVTTLHHMYQAGVDDMSNLIRARRQMDKLGR